MSGVVLALPLLFSACNNDKACDAPDTDNTREVQFDLNSTGGGLSIGGRSSVSLPGMDWKLLCFDESYNYLLERTGTIGLSSVKASIPKGVAYKVVFVCAADVSELPALQTGDDYWDLEAYAPQLPLADPMGLLVSVGDEDGTLYVGPTASRIPITLSPRAVKVVAQPVDESSGIVVNSVTFTNAAQTAPFANIEPKNYGDYANLPASFGTSTYTAATQADGVCYVLPDLCGSSSGTNATVNVTVPSAGVQNIPVLFPIGMSLNMNAGKTYYIDIKSEAGGELSAAWATRIQPKKLVIGSLNIYGITSAATVLNLFNMIDVDVLCAQECGNMVGAGTTALTNAGLYVHSHASNGQQAVSIISKYPFAGTTANNYGVYIDLGDGITALVMNCHGINKPYGPYQLNNISYGEFGGNTNVSEVVSLNWTARQGMVSKILEDFNASTTPFVSLSGDFNEPSWLDWTQAVKNSGATQYVVEWPTTKALHDGGLNGDAYRTIHPDPVAHPGYTWAPRDPTDIQDRIDMTLYKAGAKTTVKKCEILGEAAATSDVVFPSWTTNLDHRGLRTEFVYSK